jgi:hypothetical protein
VPGTSDPNLLKYDIVEALDTFIERATPVLGADHPAVVRAVEARDAERECRHFSDPP